MGVDLRLSSRDLDRTTTLVEGGLPVHLTRPGPAGPLEHPHEGRGYFIDNAVDETTSTFLVKARIPNPGGKLLPGEYVKVRMVVDRLEDAVVVPAPSVVETDSGTVVHIVDAEGKVAVRRVVAGQSHEGLRVITEGPRRRRLGHRRRAPDDPPGPRGQDGAGRTDPSRDRREPWSRPPTPRPGRSRNPPCTPRPRSDPILPGNPTVMVDFFIRRPIFATVSALLMLLIGGICAVRLPIAQYPQVAPPQVQVTTTYTGADAAERRPDGDHADRAADQRHQGDDLLQLRQHQQRRVEHRGHVRRRLLAGHGRRRHPEPGADGPGPAPARGQAVRRLDQEDVDRHGLRRQPDLARRPLRRQLPRQLRADLRRRRAEADRAASATPTCSGASTRCGSGSTPTAWPT